MSEGVIAVVGHSGKTFGEGLDGLRDALAARGVSDPLWLVVDDGALLTDKAREAVDKGADLVITWGGDGTVQCCADALAGSGVPMAIMPAGTANLLAANLGVPQDIDEALDIALDGRRVKLDVGRANGEVFAVMAGAGMDALVIGGADDDVKAKIGRLAYIASAAKSVRADPFVAEIEIDGEQFFSGEATCVLLGNVGELFGGLQPFPDAQPDDGRLEVGVVTADGTLQWLRTMARAVAGRAAESPDVDETTFTRRGTIRFDRDVEFELDGNERGAVREIDLEVDPGALVVCAPTRQQES